MSWFGLVKFVTGILVAIALLFMAGGSAARYVMTRLSELPPKPIFPEENLGAEGSGNLPEEVEASAGSEEETPPTPPPAPEPASEEEPLPEGSFQARIAQPIGMVLREGPSVETTRIGGIDYNERVIVLSESSDGVWQNVRLPGSGVEGWIKSGNTERVED